MRHNMAKQLQGRGKRATFWWPA